MILKDLSKRDAVCLLELIHESHFCNKEEGLRKLVEKVNRLVPFDHAVCALGKLNEAGLIKSYELINISYPDEWLELYVEEGYHHIDPIIKEHLKHVRLQYWADTYREYRPPKDFVQMTRSFGLRNGYAHGSRNINSRELSLFSLSAKSIDRSKRTEAILEYFVPHLHYALTNAIYNQRKPHDFSLSPREKEVINWLKIGKSSWEVSVILGISEDTVNFHVKNIMRKLGATKRTQAVAVAIAHGLIDIE